MDDSCAPSMLTGDPDFLFVSNFTLREECIMALT